MAGVLLAAVLFELALRAMSASPWARILPAVQAQFDGPDPDTGYGHRPNVEGLWLRENRAYVRINAQGLRDRPRDKAAAPRVLRVAVAGDSVTEALQVEEDSLFTLRAEREVNSKGVPVEVMNFGLSGALPLQQLLFVNKKRELLNIDVAVLSFSVHDFLNPLMADDSILPAYVENEAGDLSIGRRYRDRRSHRLAQGWLGRAFFWAVDHSLVLNALYIRAKLGLVPASATTQEASQDPCETVRAGLAAQERLWNEGEPAWAARRLERFLSDVRGMLGKMPVVFMIRGIAMRSEACTPEPERWARLSALVRNRVERSGIGFVDLDAEVDRRLPSSDDWKRMYGFGAKIGIGHLNEVGHQIYARVLTDVIKASEQSWRLGKSR